MDDTCNKRIDNLERLQAECYTQRMLRDQAIKEEEKQLDKVTTDVAEIKEYMIQQKSFVGAVMLIIGGMFAIITMFADKIFK